MNSIVLRTDFTDARAWDDVCARLSIPKYDDEGDIGLEFYSDPEYDGVTADDLGPRELGDDDPYLVFLVDESTLQSPEYLVLVMDLEGDPGTFFRAPAADVGNLQACIISGVHLLEDYSRFVDSDGVLKLPSDWYGPN
jgi:hypothetical protein